MPYESISEIVVDISDLSKRSGKKSALFITNFLVKQDVVMMNSLKESVNFIYGYCEIGEINTVDTLLKDAVENIDLIFLHTDLYRNIEKRYSNVLVFDDRKCWFDSVYSLTQILYSRNKITNVLLTGDSWLLHKVLDGVSGYALNIDILEHGLSDYSKQQVKLKQSFEDEKIRVIPDVKSSSVIYDLLISVSVKDQVLTEEHMNSLDYKVIAIDAGIGGFSKDFVRQLYSNKSDVYRVDIRSSLSALMLSVVENIDLVDNVKGAFNYKGIRVVGGGEMGFYGDVIVDNIAVPTCIIGVADGSGQTLYPPYEESLQNKVETIRKLINS